MNKSIPLVYVLLICLCNKTLNAQELKLKMLRKETKEEALIIVQPTNALQFQLYTTTNYIWRDIVSDYEAIQPSVTYTFTRIGLSLNVWNSVGMDPKTNDLETSITLNYDYALNDDLLFSIAGIYYYAPVSIAEKLDNTNFYEVMGSIQYSKPWNPRLSIYINDNKALYTIFNIRETIFNWKGYPIDINGSIAYRSNADEANGLRDSVLSIATSKNISQGISASLTAGIVYVIREKVSSYQIGLTIAFE